MTRWAVLSAAVALATTATACGSGGSPARSAAAGGTTTTMDDMKDMPGMAGMPGMRTPTADCAPSGTSLAITASGTRFDKACLAAPASRPFTIAYDNKDNISHNLVIVESDMATDVLFRADLVPGLKQQTLRVSALKPGIYAFLCEVHPERMSGTFVVR